MAKDEFYWSEHSSQLESGMVFTRHWDDTPIMLDWPVDGDSSRWTFAEYDDQHGDWAYYGDVIEPCDLKDRLEHMEKAS